VNRNQRPNKKKNKEKRKMSTVKIYQEGKRSHTHSDITCLEVDGEVVFGTLPVTFPFKVGDFVRVKRNVNVDGTEEGPMARAAGKVLSVDGTKSCVIEFPGYIRGRGVGGQHARTYFLKRASRTQLGYRPRKHEAVSCIRLIKS